MSQLKKQFRNSRFYVTTEGEVFKFYPARVYKNKWVDKNGNVKLHGAGAKRSGVDYGVDRWRKLKPTLRKNGYLVFNLQCPSVTDKGYFNTSVHRMVAECYLGPCPEGYEVDHIDGDKKNNKLSNLQYLTKEENIKKNVKGWKQ